MLTVDWVLFLLAIGLISGLLGGLLGIGGGVILVPLLFFFFRQAHLFAPYPMHVAIATSLAISLFTSLASSYFQMKKGGLDVPVLRFLIPGLFFGSLFGVILSNFLSSQFLKVFFGILTIIWGVYFSLPKLPEFFISDRPDATLRIWAIAVGILSALLGIGGGTMIFPLLLSYHLPVRKSVATSSPATFCTTFFAVLFYTLIDWNLSVFPEMLGRISLPILGLVGIASMTVTPLGVFLSHTLNVQLIKRIFGICLIAIGISMISY